MLTALQVADWIVRFRANAAAPVDPLSLQKLIFYAQAFHLARFGEPLFLDEFQAWKAGPVVHEVWRHYNNSSGPILPKEEEQLSWISNQTSISNELEADIADTVSFFSRSTSFVLSEATHREDPWMKAREGYAPDQRSSEVISRDEIRSFYAALLWDGEEALSRQELLHDLPEPRIGSFYRAGICVRGMRRHPFYSPQWVTALSRPVPADPEFTKDLLEPIKERKYLSARDL